MDHVRLGRTGLQVSRLCLGTMTFGLQCDEPTSAAILDRAAEGGIDFLDTADVYPLGGDLATRGAPRRSSAAGCEGRRDRFILATKCFGRTGPAPWDARQLAQAHPRRRRRVAAPPADRLHRPLPAARLRPADADRRDAGARSTTSSARARSATSAARTSSPTSWRGRSAAARRCGSPASTPCSRATTCSSARSSASCCPLCREEGIGVIPYNPIAGGLLSGKHNRRRGAGRGQPLHARQRRRRRTRTATGTSASSTRSSSSGPLAGEAGIDWCSLAVAWVLANPAITAPIVGASRPEQLDASLAAAETPLDPELKAGWTS